MRRSAPKWCFYLFCGGHGNFATQSVRMRIPRRRTVNRAGEAVRRSERTSASIFIEKSQMRPRSPALSHVLERFPADVPSISEAYICDGAPRKSHIELRKSLVRIGVFGWELFLMQW